MQGDCRVSSFESRFGALIKATRVAMGKTGIGTSLLPSSFSYLSSTLLCMLLYVFFAYLFSFLRFSPTCFLFLLTIRGAGIATDYGLDDQGVAVRVPVGSRIFSSPRHPDRLWGTPNLLSNGYRGLFPRG
jgi:hypothetical protein